jgi:hypothetical protein
MFCNNLEEGATDVNEQAMNNFNFFFVHACSERAAASGTVFRNDLTFTETSKPLVNMGVAECATTTCIMNHLQCF